MNYKIIVSPIASQNIEDALEYYIDKASKKVALDFLKDYRKTYKALQTNPFYQFHDNNYRFLPFDKFPYIAFFYSRCGHRMQFCAIRCGTYPSGRTIVREKVLSYPSDRGYRSREFFVISERLGSGAYNSKSSLFNKKCFLLEKFKVLILV